MIRIEVFGIPRPGGGKMPGRNKKTGKLFVRPDNENTAVWRGDVQIAVMAQYKGPLLHGPIQMSYEFRFPRPQNHFGSGVNCLTLKKTAPRWHTNKPDLTKIIRSTEDALTGLVWIDDCKVCKRDEIKRYCHLDERPGVEIFITEIA